MVETMSEARPPRHTGLAQFASQQRPG
jgi:hypothetical protein